MTWVPVDELHPGDMVTVRVEITGRFHGDGHTELSGRAFDEHTGTYPTVHIAAAPHTRLWRVHCPDEQETQR